MGLASLGASLELHRVPGGVECLDFVFGILQGDVERGEANISEF